MQMYFKSLLFFGTAILLIVPQLCFARVQLLDGALDVSGHIKEYLLIRTDIPGRESGFHKSRVGLAVTGMLMEGLLRVRDTGGLSINLFGGMRYWYDTAVTFDRRLRNAIPQQARKHYVHPRDNEYINELYVDISKGPWQLLAGKQILVWGETDIIRTADVINPLDLRYALPGIDTWQELKRGLWMLRGLYATELPGNLLFELVLIPGDFQETRLPREGTHWGLSPADTSLNPGKIFGYGHWLIEQMRRDAPGWNLRKNYEWGSRVRGYTWNIDWTLFYFDTRSDTATMNPARSLPFTLTYARAGLRTLATGAKANPPFPNYRVFRYKRYRVLGGTAQTHLEWLHGSIWRLEWFYEHDSPFNQTYGGYYGGIAYDEVRRNIAGCGLNYADKFTLPYITHSLCGDKQVEIGLTFYHEKILDHDRTLAVDPARGHRRGASTTSAVIWNVVQPFGHQVWTFIFAGSYYFNRMYFLMPLVSYAPGNHWRCEVGAALFGDGSDRARHPYRDKDSIILRIRYEW